MHEWALAESIVLTAIDVAKKEKLKKITEINIEIGELQQIEQDIFEFAIKEIIKSHEKKLTNVKLKISTGESKLKCKSCNHEWFFSDMKKKLNEDESEAIHFIPEVALVHARCPKCGSPDFDITTGRGVSISSIKGER
jgi:hydrogenase nickel incorporation protein HypA/HybF